MGTGLAKDKLIVALDYSSAGDALRFARSVQGRLTWLKVGLELYIAAGPDVVRELRGLGFRVFLDLKLYDIPNTVAGAVRSASQSGAELLTVHASGGPAMLEAAQQAAGADLKLLGVTVVTSMDAAQLSATGVTTAPAEQVLRLAKLVQAAGLNGLVCSSQEVSTLRGQLNADILLVTPGIRPAGSAADDQRRTATPAGAMQAGSDMLVVGRPVTQAADPAAAVNAILAEMENSGA